ncbi:MAG TPA: hypothetical protein VJ011_08785 [Steroidobacteraceae bacterium]|nr:hypothetical protein [Steroidobacteraceae bacterium]
MSTEELLVTVPGMRPLTRTKSYARSGGGWHVVAFDATERAP